MNRDVIQSGVLHIVDLSRFRDRPPALLVTFNTWAWNLSFESIVIPRSVGRESSEIVEFPSVYTVSTLLECRLKCVTLHSDIFSFKPHDKDVSEKHFMSFWAECISASSFVLKKSLKSSAKSMYSFVKYQPILLIKIINRIGPRTDPCGTPLFTGRGLLFASPTATCICLPVKNDSIQERIDPQIPRLESF